MPRLYKDSRPSINKKFSNLEAKAKHKTRTNRPKKHTQKKLRKTSFMIRDRSRNVDYRGRQ